MIKILTTLLVQLFNLYLFVKTTISSFGISSPSVSVKNATKSTSLSSFRNLPSSKHTEGDTAAVTPSLKAIGIVVPSFQAQTQPKANTIGKQRTKIRKSRYSILSKLNEIPNSPGVQCATM